MLQKTGNSFRLKESENTQLNAVRIPVQDVDPEMKRDIVGIVGEI